jgi:hypothetical protein
MVTVLLALLALGSPQAGGNWPTLAAELAERAVPLPAGVDGSRQITSFSEFDDDHWFVIGYYDLRADATLRTLHVRAFNRRSKQWRSAIFDEVGAVLELTHHGRLFYVRGHSSPSSSPLLVLGENLTLKRQQEGWVKWTVDDGRVIFERGMVHFAPAHSAVLAVYNPRTNRDDSFYPAAAGRDRTPEFERDTNEWIDRTIGEVKNGPAVHTIAFTVTIQRVRVGEDNLSLPIGAPTRQRVTCSVRLRVPTCSSIQD